MAGATGLAPLTLSLEMQAVLAPCSFVAQVSVCLELNTELTVTNLADNID